MCGGDGLQRMGKSPSGWGWGLVSCVYCLVALVFYNAALQYVANLRCCWQPEQNGHWQTPVVTSACRVRWLLHVLMTRHGCESMLNHAGSC